MPLKLLIPIFVRTNMTLDKKRKTKFDKYFVDRFNSFERERGYRGLHTKQSLLKKFRLLYPNLIEMEKGIPYIKNHSF